MSIWKLVDQFDHDGAVAETAEAAAETRGSFLKKAGLGAGMVVAGTSLAGAAPAFARSTGAIPASDIAILNFALTLEYLEAAFYAEAVAGKKLSGETLRFASVVAQHEAQHVAALKAVLKSKAVASPKFDFQGTTMDQAKFEATADVLEFTGVHAYLGQAGNIKAKPILAAAASILAIEARHSAWIRDIRFHGGTTAPTTPAPAGFEEGYTKAHILAAVKGTGFIVG